MPRLDVPVLVEDERARADERHLARDDVEELRQLVDPPAPQEAPDARDARVVRHLEHPRIAAAVHVQMRDLGLPDSASATIVRNLKTRNVRSPAPIRTCRKNTGPRESSLISDRERREQRCEEDEAERRADEVERALEEARRIREPRDGQPDQRNALDRVQLGVRAEHLEHARDDVDLDVAVLHRADHLERLLVRIGRERDHDAVRPVLADEVGRSVVVPSRSSCRRRSAKRRSS